jgi:hypothetical protein
MKCEHACHYNFTTNASLVIGVSDEMSEAIPVQTGPLHYTCHPVLTWLLASCVSAYCTINPASTCQMVRRYRSPEHVHNFKTDHIIVRYTLLDTTFGIPPETEAAMAQSIKGKLCITLATEIRYSKRIKGVCYGVQHWHRGFVNVKRGKAPPVAHPQYLIPVRQIESRKEMSHIAQITKTQTSVKRRKKGILKKNAGAAQLLTIVIGASAVGLAVHEKRDSSTSTVSAAGREDPHHFSPPPTALP